jgi:hypothetical protein
VSVIGLARVSVQARTLGRAGAERPARGALDAPRALG